MHLRRLSSSGAWTAVAAFLLLALALSVPSGFAPGAVLLLLLGLARWPGVLTGRIRWSRPMALWAGSVLVMGLVWSMHITDANGRLVTSTLGFLAHNWPPASIFMGDVGSAFLGFTLATIAVIAGGIDARLPLIGALFIWPFIFDPIFTILSRLRRRENIFQAHRGHLYQRLVIGGYSHRFVTLLYSYLALSGVFLAWAWFLRIPGSEAAIVVLMPLMAASLWGFVVRHERRLAAQARPAAAEPVENQPET